MLRWAVNINRFYQSHASSVSSGHPDRISSMGGDFLDVLLVREASKSTIIYNTTRTNTRSDDRPTVGPTQASRTSAENIAS